MLLGRGMVAMIRNDPGEVKSQCRSNTCRQSGWLGVEDHRRQMREGSIAGKKIRREHELKAFAVKTHVPVGMTGEMNCPQSPPNFDEVTIVEKPIRGKRLEGQNGSADTFKVTRDSRPAVIAGMARVMIRVETRSCYPSTVLPCNRTNIENVIEMPVSNYDSKDRLLFPATFNKRAV